jgi:hypothetical protein
MHSVLAYSYPRAASSVSFLETASVVSGQSHIAVLNWVQHSSFVGARYQSPYCVVYATENRYQRKESERLLERREWTQGNQLLWGYVSDSVWGKNFVNHTPLLFFREEILFDFFIQLAQVTNNLS